MEKVLKKNGVEKLATDIIFLKFLLIFFLILNDLYFFKNKTNGVEKSKKKIKIKAITILLE